MAADLAEGPGGMAADERLRIVEGGGERGDAARVAMVAEGDGGVAEDPAPLRAKERRAFEAAAERRVVEREEIGERRGHVVVGGGTEGFPSRRLRNGVPRAHVLADIAAEDPASDGAPQVARNRATE